MVANPLALPSWLKFEEFKMRPVDTKVVSQLEGRFTETANFGTPYWALTEARTAYLTDAQIDDLEAFFHQAQRGGATFHCPDHFRLRPRAYGDVALSGTKAGGGAFNGDAVISAISNSRQVTISGLPSGFSINRGCLFEVRKTLLARSLHRVTASVVANGSGVAVVAFESPLDTGIFTTAATAHFEKPGCVMMLSEWDMPRAYGGRKATFSATEVFFS